MAIVSRVTDASGLVAKARNTPTSRYMDIRLGENRINVKDFGAYGDGILGGLAHDDTAAIQAAINAAHAQGIPTVYFPPGRYNISSTLYIFDYINLEGDTGWMGYGSPRAALYGQTHNMTMLSFTLLDGVTGVHYCSVRNIEFQTQYTALIAIAINNSVVCSVERCVFGNLIDNATGIHGGGNLYVYINHNQCTGSYGYFLDMNNTYSTSPSLSYYGINVGTCHYNVVSANHGIRFQGEIDIAYNDFENSMSSKATIDLTAPGGPFFCSIRHNYFEIQYDSLNVNPMKGIIFQGCGNIVGNVMYGYDQGLSGSMGIDCFSMQSGEVTGNSIFRFETGIRAASSYNSRCVYFGNTISSVNNLISYSSGWNASSTGDSMASLDMPDYLINDPGTGWIFSKQLALSLLSAADTGTDVNLSKGNIILYTNTSPTTVRTFSNPMRGTQFLIGSTNANLTLYAGNFQNSMNADLHLPTYTYVPFVVGPNFQAHEVGLTSRWLAPVAASQVWIGPAAGSSAAPMTLRSISTSDILYPIHDVDAPIGCAFLGLDHLDGSGDPKWCRKGHAGNVVEVG